VLERVEVLGEHPYIGRKVPEYDLAELREVSERPYRIIYRVDADEGRLDILTVKHYRQRLPTHLPDL
jgi:plasmid stabilization system protein ParE